MTAIDLIKKRKFVFGMTLFLSVEGILLIIMDLAGLVDKNLANERYIELGRTFFERNGLYFGIILLTALIPLTSFFRPPKKVKLLDERDFAINDKSAVYAFVFIVFLLGQLTIIEALSNISFNAMSLFALIVPSGVLFWGLTAWYLGRVS